MDTVPAPAEAELISIIGNLLDNAIEATQRARCRTRRWRC
jgi:sensor histidine kinase regulating citrate/malate metabolism